LFNLAEETYIKNIFEHFESEIQLTDTSGKLIDGTELCDTFKKYFTYWNTYEAANDDELKIKFKNNYEGLFIITQLNTMNISCQILC
jgi:hypothetical protein